MKMWDNVNDLLLTSNTPLCNMKMKIQFDQLQK